VLDAGYRLAYAPDAIVYHRNERTPWGLMREGYVHAYHAVAVASLHAGLGERLRRRGRVRVRLGSWHPHRLARPRSTRLWAYLFDLGKRIGRRRAARETRDTR
jgi:GT2 family glycosyltransferase